MYEQEKREKVIKGLEHCVEKLDTVVNKSHGFNCTACPYFRKCDRSGYLIGLPLLHDALALLKAQEPMDAIVVPNGIDRSGGWWFQCPNCKMEIEPRDKYCRSCGQGVKWE